MRFSVIARDVSSSAATIAVAVAGADPAGRRVVVRADGRDYPITSWLHHRGVHHQRVPVDRLAPARRYGVDLSIDGATAAAASFRTLPTVLPPPGEKPFTLLLGSCFCRRQDEEGRVETAYLSMPAAASPDLHVWAGDQVYLDSPWYRFSRPHSAEELESEFRENYDLTWQARRGSGSLGAVLGRAANYFTSDDHEFWNNAPNRGAYVVNSWTAGGRETWKAIAGELYGAFQTHERVTQLAIGDVSLCTADVRIDRDDEEERFMRDRDLDRVCDWLEGLGGPGFLALGQPVFTEEAGFGGHFLDWGLPDYEQYGRLARALSEVDHSVVVLTGDVHFGRIARCTLPSGAELLEIISSPLALVDPRVRGKWRPAPERFPSKPLPGVVRSPVVTEAFRVDEAHFLTLELSAIGQAVDLTVKFWPIEQDQETRGRAVFQRRLR